MGRESLNNLLRTVGLRKPGCFGQIRFDLRHRVGAGLSGRQAGIIGGHELVEHTVFPQRHLCTVHNAVWPAAVCVSIRPALDQEQGTLRVDLASLKGDRSTVVFVHQHTKPAGIQAAVA